MKMYMYEYANKSVSGTRGSSPLSHRRGDEIGRMRRGRHCRAHGYPSVGGFAAPAYPDGSRNRADAPGGTEAPLFPAQGSVRPTRCVGSWISPSLGGAARSIW